MNNNVNKNIQVLKHCPHFYTIINYNYYGDDAISERLINVYKNYIFSANIGDLDNIGKIEKLDKILYKYVNDYSFRIQIKKDIMTIKVEKSENILETIVNAIIKLFENYENLKVSKINLTRWI